MKNLFKIICIRFSIIKTMLLIGKTGHCERVVFSRIVNSSSTEEFNRLTVVRNKLIDKRACLIETLSEKEIELEEI